MVNRQLLGCVRRTCDGRARQRHFGRYVRDFSRCQPERKIYAIPKRFLWGACGEYRGGNMRLSGSRAGGKKVDYEITFPPSGWV